MDIQNLLDQRWVAWTYCRAKETPMVFSIFGKHPSHEWVVAKRMITLPCQLHTNNPQPEGSSTARSMILRMHVSISRVHVSTSLY